MSIADLLGSYDIEIGYPDRREQIAKRLADVGVSETDVRMLHAYCTRSTDPWHVAGLLYWLLESEDRWRPKLLDLRRYASIRPGFGDRPYVPKPQEGEDWEVWQAERRAGMLRCRVREVGLAQAAEELGYSPDEARSICGKEEVRLASGSGERGSSARDRRAGRRKPGASESGSSEAGRAGGHPDVG